jgi:hypothetical protein
VTRREVLEYLVHVWGVRDLGRLRRLTREHLAYQSRKGYGAPARYAATQTGCENR